MGHTLLSREKKISPSSWIASCGTGENDGEVWKHVTHTVMFPFPYSLRKITGSLRACVLTKPAL